MSLLVEHDKQIAILTLNRPEKRNALNKETIDQLIQELNKAYNDPDVRGVLIKGAGPAFCAGGDIQEMIDRYGKALVTKNRLDRGLNEIVRLIRKIKCPVVAAVHGSCYGAGLVIATACDVLYAHKDAKFGLSFGNMGLIPEASYFLARYIGLHRIKELVFSRAAISGSEAFGLGLVTRVFEDSLVEKSLQKLHEWAQGPIETIGLAKQVLNHAFESDLESHLNFEALAQGAAFTGKEHKEGVDAFLEKRKVNFQDL